MKRIIALMLCLLIPICFVGCAEEPEDAENTTPVVIIPDYTTKATVNGYKQFSANHTETKEENEISDEYYANKSTKKFHIGSCSYATKIKTENLYTAKDRNELITAGYEPCKKCNP